MGNYQLSQLSKCQSCFLKSVRSGSKLQPFFIPASNGFHFLPPVSAQPWLGCEGKTQARERLPGSLTSLGSISQFSSVNCQVTVDRKFAIIHFSSLTVQLKIHKTFPILYWKYKLKVYPPPSPEMAINSLIIVTRSPPPPRPDHRPRGHRGQPVSLGVSLARGQTPARSKNINIPIQRLIARLSADNGSDTRGHKSPPAHREKISSFLPPFIFSHDSTDFLRMNVVLSISCLLQERYFTL